MMSSEAATNPPIEASDFEKVPTMRSTSSATPKCAAVPSPLGPSTPTACASSIASAAPYFWATLSRFGTSAMSPSIENTPSTMIMTPVPTGTFWSLRSSPAMSPWLMRQPEIVIGAHHDARLAFDHHDRVFRLRNRLEPRVQAGRSNLVGPCEVLALVEERDVLQGLGTHGAPRLDRVENSSLESSGG